VLTVSAELEMRKEKRRYETLFISPSTLPFPLSVFLLSLPFVFLVVMLVPFSKSS